MGRTFTVAEWHCSRARLAEYCERGLQLIALDARARKPIALGCYIRELSP